jgi:hypothetical protein
MIEVLDSDEEAALDAATTEPTISISALTGIQPRKGRTMHVFVTIHGAVLRALLDSELTHNFVDLEVAACVGIVFSGHNSLSIAGANGDRMASLGCCTNLKISIANDDFIVDCYGLSLGSFEMVLGVQWLESLGPILWDFKNRTMSFEHHGHVVRWSASSPPTPLGPSLATA